MKWLSRLKKRSTTDTPERLPKEKTVKEMQDGFDKLKMEPQANTISEMPNKKSRKKLIKELQKELDDLIEEYIKMELRPCRGDADLHQREKDLEMLRQKIRIAEREIDRHLYTV
jgi:hypothetical protein